VTARDTLPDLSLYEHRARAKSLVDPAIAVVERTPYYFQTPPEVMALVAADPDLQRSIVISLMALASTDIPPLRKLRGMLGGDDIQAPVRIIAELGSQRPPFTRNDVVLLLALAAHAIRQAHGFAEWLVMGLVSAPLVAVERAVRRGGVDELEGPIRDLAKALSEFKGGTNSQQAKARARLLVLLQPAAADDGSVEVDPTLFDEGDTWGVEWRSRARSLPAPAAAMIVHCSVASGVTPSKAWLARAKELARGDGVDRVLDELLTGSLESRSTQPVQVYEWDGQRFESSGPAVTDPNVLILRGAMWAAASLDDAWPDERLTTIALHFGTSGGSSNIARDERLANTAAAALGSRGTTASIAGLGRMKARVTNRNVSKQIVKALDAAAASSGMSPSALLELAVSPEGLDAESRREVPVADHAAVLAIDGDDATLTWRAPDGRVTARPPVAIAERAADVNRAKEALKDLRKALGIERGRVEDLFTEDREWSVADWRTRYLGHPLTKTIASRLLWTILDGDARTVVLPAGAELHDIDGGADQPSDAARVRPWHPIDATDDEIGAWRTRIIELRLRQPFKQAFREVYRLTPAEEETDTYSNRFAAHILRYPQARALMTARRWGSNFLGPYDGGYNGIAKREFRTQGMRAEFWHDAVETDDPMAAEVLFCTTDQVRFVGEGRDGELLHLRDVPPIVFSEAMRDVDLFVSVTTVGADANWTDGWRERQAAGPFGDYVSTYYGAPLNASASVRRDVLERMIPGLAIADRLTLEDRHLAVRGDLRAYRIHLGSGNIYMAPSDAYVCIVPARGKPVSTIFLPFDDDPTLSVILSKAFLLAKDSKITDRSIVAQIRR
jgi:hypothetical protein